MTIDFSQIRMLSDRVLIEKAVAEETTAGRHGAKLALPDQGKEKPNKGVVKAVGKGVFTPEGNRRPLEVSAGDKVTYGKFSGTEVKLDGLVFHIVQERDIFLVDERNG